MEEMVNNLNQMLSNLTPIFEKISEVFCVSIDTIQSHGMEYILLYGQYQLTLGIMISFFTILLMFLTFVGVIYGINYNNFSDRVYNRETEKYENTYMSLKEQIQFIGKPLKLAGVISVILFISRILVSIIPYMISPEIYSIKQAMYLLQ